MSSKCILQIYWIVNEVSLYIEQIQLVLSFLSIKTPEFNPQNKGLSEPDDDKLSFMSEKCKKYSSNQ